MAETDLQHWSASDFRGPDPLALPPSGRIAIKDWHETDQPREKFMNRGREAVSDAELLGILLGSGTMEDSAVDLGRKLLALAGNSLHRLARLDWQQLKAVKGIGDARAITIAAALELGRRHAAEAPEERPILSSAGQAYRHMRPYMEGLAQEQFWVILTATNNQVIRTLRVGEGGIDGVIADPRIVFRQALLESAASLILVHNHPSGAQRPSTADDELTRSMVQAGDFLQLRVLDHIIYTDLGYYSYADQLRLRTSG